uniref:Glutamate receptor 1-like n=1 Tax=Saccoglossus kowalevskii TaxID=10224 RepID=A0ABM0GI66_SACKO|nr:PREDICTED: glutamate receptor 1-like [Saccoglossus kowalevskii]
MPAGVLLEEDPSESEILALVLAAKYVNENPSILPFTKFSYFCSRISRQFDSFEYIQNVCRQVSKEIVTMVGPLSSQGVRASYPITSALHIPQIAILATDSLLSLHQTTFPYLMKMTSPDYIQSAVLVDLVEHFKWTRFAILTSHAEYGVNGLVREFHTMAVERDWSIVSVEQFWPTNNRSELDVTEQLMNIRSKGVRIVLLHCHALYANVVLRQAERLGMTGKGWAWIATDIVTTMPGLYDTNGTIPSFLLGMVGTRPSIGNGELAEVLHKYWNVYNGTFPIQPFVYHIFDAILAVAYALTEYFEDGLPWSPPNYTRKVCADEESLPWVHGSVLMQYLEQVSGPGTARYLNFTHTRTPAVTVYDIVNFKANGTIQIGEWRTKGDIDVNSSLITFMGATEEAPVDNDYDLSNTTLIITTILEEPFMMVRSDNTTGNDRFHGFCKDLLDKLQMALQFEYELELVPDGNFGSLDPETGEWNGMVRQLKEREVDWAVAPFTISYERQQTIDFTKPYLDLGLTILLGHEKKERRLFQFLEPFSTDLWIAIFVSMVACGVGVSLCSYFSPYGFHGMYIQRIDLSEQRSYSSRKLMSLPQAFWFAFASWTHQGAEYTPRCLSGRVVGGFWWLAVTVIIATYTANLAAYLTAARLNSGINSIDDLANSDIYFGTVADSQPQSFFEQSDSDPYRRMSSLMQAYDTLVDDSVAGINKVRNGKYAFIWDSAVLDYAASKPPCDVRTVGATFAKIGYGIGLQLNSPHTERVTLEILRLRQKGFIDKLNQKYFKGDCQNVGDGSTPGETTLNFHGMAGVFYCLFGGFAVGLLVVVIEWCWAAYRERRDHKQMTWCQAASRRAARTRDDFVETCLCCGMHPEDEITDRQTGTENGHTIPDYEYESPGLEECPLRSQLSIKSPNRQYRLNSCSFETTESIM